MNEVKTIDKKQILLLFGMGAIGVLSLLPVIPDLVALGEQPPLPMAAIQAISFVQSAILLLAMVALGAWLAPKVNLSAPVISTFLGNSRKPVNIKSIGISAVIGGVLGGVLLLSFYQFMAPHLPKDFLDNAARLSLPVYTKILYGGITEELLMRWGVMSLLVWLSYRITQTSGSAVKNYNYVFAIVVSAVVFGLGHLPVAFQLSATATTELLVYVIVGNSIFGFIAGFLFWRKGLEAAILAHMLAHIVMIVGELVVA